MQDALHCHHLPLSEGSSLALWELAPSQPNGQHLFLTHGTFSTKHVCMGLADFFAQYGYRCWMLEWRGHGQSSSTPAPYDFETIAHEDIPVALVYLFEQQNISYLHGLTHSGGGICLSLALLHVPAYRKRFKSLVFFACQAFGAAHNHRNYAKIWLGKQLARILGRVPVGKVGGEQDEQYPLMKQWFDWNLKGHFVGKKGQPYVSMLSAIRVPVLSICGEGDTLIAPVEGCRRYLTAFDNPHNQLLYCSIDGGFAEAYTHSRLLRSTNARRELYPKALEWVQAHS